ncbi:FecR family protein [Sphingomonas sp.]|uniref:FecR family protein n=1 Tax=Sphingomonas sp. TaxID=28214 RepID=UPI002EDBA159
MMKFAAGLCAAVMLATTSSAALAQSQIWRISEAAGAVSVRRGTEIKPAARNTVLAPGDAVVTGPGARAVLVHDRDFVTVSANSRVSVPLMQEASGFTRIVQDIGNAIFRIEKLKVPHFAVKTPYLAAVVKGTIFSVTVDGSGTSLQVVEGVVEVATLDGGAKDLIRPGTVATIGAADLYRLQVQGDGARTIDSPARPADPPTTTGAIVPAAAVGVASTPVLPEAGGAAPIGFDSGAQTIGEAISSKPIDLASITGGMMTGTTAAASVMLVASVKLETLAPPPEAAAEPSVASAAPVADTPPIASPATDTGTPAEPPAQPEPVATIPVATAPVANDSVTAGAEAGKAAGDAKKAADDLAKEQEKAAKDAATEAEKAAKDAGGAADAAAKDAAKTTEDAKKAADDAAKQAAKNAADNAAKEAAKNVADDAAREAAKNAADDAAKEAAKNAVDDAAREAAKNAADDAAKEAAKNAKEAKEAADDAAKSAAKAAQDALDAAAELAKAARDKPERDEDDD